MAEPASGHGRARSKSQLRERRSFGDDSPAKRGCICGTRPERVTRRVREANEPLVVVVMGASMVGKSSLVRRFATGRWELRGEPSMGAVFSERVYVHSGRGYRVHLWDTPGLPKYQVQNRLYYRAVEAALVVYDITSPASFDRMKEWCAELRSLGPEDLRLVVIGNKCDRETWRKVSVDEGVAFAREVGALWCALHCVPSVSVSLQYGVRCNTRHEVSAKRESGITELFDEIVGACRGVQIASAAYIPGGRLKAQTANNRLNRGGSSNRLAG